MSTNNPNEAFADKNDKAYFDSEGAPDGELSQDELDNVSGGRVALGPDGRVALGPDDKATAARPVEVDPSDPALR